MSHPEISITSQRIELRNSGSEIPSGLPLTAILYYNYPCRYPMKTETSGLENFLHEKEGHISERHPDEIFGTPEENSEYATPYSFK